MRKTFTLRRKINFSVLLLAFSTISCVTGPINARMVSKAKIQFVYLYTTTTIGVNCAELKEYFGTRLNERLIQDADKLDQLINHVNDVVSHGEKYTQRPDARVFVELLDNNSKSLGIICVGSVSLSYNDDVYIIDETFRDFLVKYLKDMK